MTIAIPPPLPLFTGRYRTFRPEFGVPVRITVGAPRNFRHSYDQALALAPYELMRPPYKGIDDIDIETRVYRARLATHEDDILAQLEELAAKYSGQAAVLLCYEDVLGGQACHRRWAAEWLGERFGWDVPEIDPARDAKIDPNGGAVLPFPE